MKRLLTYTFLLLFSLFSVLFVAAQDGPPGFEDDVQDVPFDGGVIGLVAAGVAYGIKKARHKKLKKN